MFDLAVQFLMDLTQFVMKKKLMDYIGWGLILWVTGYLASLVAFFLVKPEQIGWVVGPVMLVATLWVLMKKIDPYEVIPSLLLGITWAVIAVILDYFLIVRLFNPADGYYKLDVYLYYGLTLLLPPVVTLFRSQRKEKASS